MHSDLPVRPDSNLRLRVLVETNLGWLDQAIQLVATLSDAHYAGTPPGFAPHRAGSHLRHILDFYSAFLTGLETRFVDYDARGRDRATEQHRAHAIERMRGIQQRLREVPGHDGEGSLWVRMEDTVGSPDLDPWMLSSVSRELQTLSSHTIHHFALIAFTLRAHGLDIDPNFGMAPSTLRQGRPQAA